MLDPNAELGERLEQFDWDPLRACCASKANSPFVCHRRHGFSNPVLSSKVSMGPKWKGETQLPLV